MFNRRLMLGVGLFVAVVCVSAYATSSSSSSSSEASKLVPQVTYVPVDYKSHTYIFPVGNGTSLMVDSKIIEACMDNARLVNSLCQFGISPMNFVAKKTKDQVMIGILTYSPAVPIQK